MTSLSQGVIAHSSRGAVPWVRWLGALVIVTAAVGMVIYTFSNSARRSTDSDADPDFRKANDALAQEYATQLAPARRHKALIQCQHVKYLKRHITWCGVLSGPGRWASKGYWELERVGDEVIVYAMNGEALRALTDFTGTRFQPGYKQPFLDLNALEAAYAMDAKSRSSHKPTHAFDPAP